MKNIPMFTTEAGIASLILEEIPYKKTAYIKIQSSVTPDVLLADCVAFCNAVGAEQIYASGHDYLVRYPLHTQMVRMECKLDLLSPTKLDMRWIDDSSARLWCEIYNDRMQSVPNAATLTLDQVRKLIPEKVCCLVYEGEQLLGIGKITDKKVDVIASVVPGRGADVMMTLCSVIKGDAVTVEVASNNSPAVRLYEKLGFKNVETISTWYCVN